MDGRRKRMTEEMMWKEGMEVEEADEEKRQIWKIGKYRIKKVETIDNGIRRDEDGYMQRYTEEEVYAFAQKI